MPKFSSWKETFEQPLPGDMYASVTYVETRDLNGNFRNLVEWREEQRDLRWHALNGPHRNPR